MLKPARSQMAAGSLLLRGVLTAVISVGLAAVAHAAGAANALHLPHPVVFLFALLIATPLATALMKVRLSRWRLGAAVVLTQLVLHLLFAVFPAVSAAPMGVSTVSMGGHEHAVGLSVGTTAVHSASAHSEQWGSAVLMAISHLGAALLAYGLLRRGEVILSSLREVLTLAPVMILLAPRPLAQPRRARLVPVVDVPALVVRALVGGLGLRGPPVVNGVSFHH